MVHSTAESHPLQVLSLQTNENLRKKNSQADLRILNINFDVRQSAYIEGGRDRLNALQYFHIGSV